MADKLKEYNQKRKFDKTAEPKGDMAKSSGKKLRFVVQHHIATRDHFDLRLELDGTMKSWAVPKGPSYYSSEKRLAIMVEDHPIDYRNFEGTIPKGEYGGGTVMIWDEGCYEPYGDAAQGLAKGDFKFTLNGSRLKGRWVLVHINPRPGEKDNNWLLIKEKDAYEGACDLRQFTTSVRTNRTMAEIGKDENAEVKLDMKKQKSQEAKTKTVKATASAAPAKKQRKDIVLNEITITNANKLLYEDAGITKGDVAKYYAKVAEHMLPYVGNRILSTVRCPDGVDGACFYKKHPAKGSENIAKIEIPSSKGEPEEYYYVPDSKGLLSEVQMNTLEFHIWGSRVETLEKPDMMVFDLDPDEGMDIAQIRQGVRDLKSLLDDLSLVSYLKTSGGKGYHIVVPFQPATGWDVFHNFAKNIAQTMEEKWPDRYTSNVRKNQRNNRIFIDWIRNGRGATSVAPYSIRARDGAPVSMPIKWSELDKIGPKDITMEEAIKRLRRKDPWADFYTHNQKLK